MPTLAIWDTFFALIVFCGLSNSVGCDYKYLPEIGYNGYTIIMVRDKQDSKRNNSDVRSLKHVDLDKLVRHARQQRNFEMIQNPCKLC